MMFKRIKSIVLTTALVAALSGLALAQRDDDDRDNHRDDDRSNHSQDTNRQWGQNRNADAREYGFHNGYRAGFQYGRNLRNTRSSNDNYNHRDNYNNNGYRRDRTNDADGYQESMGSRGQYKKGYREGYSNGFNDASNNRAPQYPYVYGQNGQRRPWDPDGDDRQGANHDNNYGNDPNYNSNPNYSNNPNYNNDPNYNNTNHYGVAARFGMQDGLTLGRSDRQRGHSSRPTEWKAYKDADHGMSAASGYSSEQYKRDYRQAFMAGYEQGYRYNR